MMRSLESLVSIFLFFVISFHDAFHRLSRLPAHVEHVYAPGAQLLPRAGAGCQAAPLRQPGCVVTRLPRLRRRHFQPLLPAPRRYISREADVFLRHIRRWRYYYPRQLPFAFIALSLSFWYWLPDILRRQFWLRQIVFLLLEMVLRFISSASFQLSFAFFDVYAAFRRHASRFHRFDVAACRLLRQIIFSTLLIVAADIVEYTIILPSVRYATDFSSLHIDDEPRHRRRRPCFRWVIDAFCRAELHGLSPCWALYYRLRHFTIFTLSPPL